MSSKTYTMQEIAGTGMFCINCKHYLQHYIRLDGYYEPLPWGHCINRKRTSNKFDGVFDRCMNFERREEDGNGDK